MKYPVYILFFILALFLGSFSSCASFVLDEDVSRLRDFERNENGEPVNYIMLNDVDINGDVLKKNTEVRILIVTGDDFIKVYAFNSAQRLLESKRFLVLYVFKEDFPNEIYSEKLFREMLEKVLKPV